MTDIDSTGQECLGERRLVIGLCGGIACYKIAFLASTLVQAGAEVTAVMTEAATRFLGPLTLEALTGRAVCTSPFDAAESNESRHVALSRWADLVLVAPCTMDMLAKLATGRADDAVSLLVAATNRRTCPVLLAPAMNETMLQQPSTVRNLSSLREDGFRIVEPGMGWQACRTEGEGRLAEPGVLVEAIVEALGAASRDPR